MTQLFLILIALTAALGGWLLVELIARFMRGDRERIQERLSAAKIATEPTAYRPVVLPKADERGSESGLIGKFDRKLVRACPGTTLRQFFFVVAILAMGFFTIAAFLTRSMTVGALAAAMAAMIPFMVVQSRSARRQKIIDDQLPEALDFLARILRAGHSLATAFQMSGEELPDPLASEFRRCYEQHSLGQHLEEALKEMADRVDVPDFAFFVTAVLIQRQTGGDLAEVLKNIGGMVRSRIRLQQHVRAITAEGRLVGTILLILPVVFFIILYMLNPEYAGVLLTTTEGRFVMLACVVMQALGYVTIRRIVAVKL